MSVELIAIVGGIFTTTLTVVLGFIVSMRQLRKIKEQGDGVLSRLEKDSATRAAQLVEVGIVPAPKVLKGETNKPSDDVIVVVADGTVETKLESESYHE